jgi:hypothetical protein
MVTYELELVAEDGLIAVANWRKIKYRLLELQPARRVVLIGEPPGSILVSAVGHPPSGPLVAPGLLAEIEGYAATKLIVRLIAEAPK